MALAFTGACGGTPEEVADAVGEKQAAITGGGPVLSNVEPYSSAVRLSHATTGQHMCSAVKIGPRRFLTASHCIGFVDPKPSTGARIKITNSLDGTGGTTVGINRFYPHPSYRFPSTQTLADWGKVKDIAVLDVLGDTPSIPALPAMSTTFGDGWIGTDVAYGCDNINGSPFGTKQTADFTSATLAEFQNFFVQTGYSHATAYANYMVFDGQPRFPGAPPDFFRMLCGGDSGGPMFGFDNGWKVAGINSHVFSGGLTPPARISMTTRVAAVASWIASSNKIRGEHGSLTNALTGKCLGVNKSTSEFAPVVQELCADRTFTSNSQFWSKEDVSGGYVRFVNGRSGMCLHAVGASIEQRRCEQNSAAQRWLILVGSPSLTPLINSAGSYAGVRDAVTDVFGTVKTDLGADEAVNRQRWIWTG